ncbi:hypothetical protein TNCV_5121601 [Trichonephila clavipes]|nr:hypothetical protein TNCV_5121601 [Trichonephila clavipes]
MHVWVSGPPKISTAAGSGYVTTVIQNKKGDFSTPLELLIVPYITTTYIHRMDATKVNIPSNIDLADKDFCVPGEIDMLIGHELFFELLRPNKFRSPCEKMSVSRDRFWVHCCREFR